VRSTVPLSRMGKEQYGEPTVPPPHTGVPRADTDASAVLVHRGLGRLIRVACSRAGSSRLTGVGTGRRLAGGRTSPCPCPKRPGGSSAAGARRVDAGAGGPVTRSLGRATSAGSVYGASCKKCSSDVRLLVADDGALAPGVVGPSHGPVARIRCLPQSGPMRRPDCSSGTWAVIVALISQSAPRGGSLPTCSSGTAAWRSWSSSSASSIHASSCEVVQSSRSEQAASRKNSRSSKWYRRWAQAVETP